MVQTYQICAVLVALFALASSQDNEQLGYNKLPGQLIDISVREDQLWGLDRSFKIYQFRDLLWGVVSFEYAGAKAIGFTPAQVAASSDGWAWVIDSAGSVYRYNTATHAWDRIQVSTFIQVSANTKDAAIAVSKDHKLYAYNPTAGKFVYVKTAQDGKIAWASLCNKGEQWLVDNNGFVYHYNPAKKVFDRVAGQNVAKIDCQSKSRVVATTNNGNVYHWEKASSTWHQLPGGATRATVSVDNVYLVNEMENVYTLEFSSIDKATLDAGGDDSGSGGGGAGGNGGGTVVVPSPPPPTLAPVEIPSKEDDSFADTNAYVFCSNAPLDPSSFLPGRYKPAWQWLTTAGNYVMVKGHWNTQSCSFGGVTTLRVTKEVYDNVAAKCKKAGFDTVQPANSILSEYKAFEVQGTLQPYWREIEHWTWWNPLAFNSYERMKGGNIKGGCS